ncbi:uncharacterized protein LOC102802941 [Saccoglossus kowalevskii]|uniref:Pre-mRNA-splicing factor PRP46-like n=1 Tax=Saccoglossus kowalevskii TaxID=10224 RepID=A0ABM0MPN3_SACKO|nr:PREDICTED: pre-mRNA-splicing factor PRP46-like [Saccoglossus kowalevskii]
MAATTEREIRKLRKKLRQIESLEHADRELNDEELGKVAKKDSIRITLQEILAQFTESEDDHQNSSTDSLEQLSGTESMLENTSHSLSQDSTFSHDERIIKRKLNDEESIEEIPSAVIDDSHVPVEPHPAKISKKELQPSNRGDSQNEEIKGKKKTQTVSRQSQMLEAQKVWRSSKFTVRQLEGHNDLICAVDCDESVIVTGSRDTMVKIWDGDIGCELRSLGGHTGTVTGVRLLKQDESGRLAPRLEVDKTHQIAISCSLDCSIKLWNLTTGEMIKSIYTFNPLLCISYLPEDYLIASGSDGGKIELWNIIDGTSLHSEIAYDAEVTDMQLCSKNCIVSSSADGLLKVWQLRGYQLSLVFVSEDVSSSTSSIITLRKIHCLAAHQDVIFYGDNGVNVKVLQWKTANLHKLRNHLDDFGSTDAMYIQNDVMVCSGFDLDHGHGYINVWTIPGEHYLGTLNDKSTSHIYAISSTKTKIGTYRIITGGNELKLWDQIHQNSKIPKGSYGIDFNWSYTIKPTDSESESDADFSEEDEINRPRSRRRSSGGLSHEPKESGGLWSWCSLV